MRYEYNLQPPVFTVENINIQNVSRPQNYKHSFRNGRTAHGFIYTVSGRMCDTFLSGEDRQVFVDAGEVIFIPKGCRYTATYLEENTEIKIVQFDIADGSLPPYLCEPVKLGIPNAGKSTLLNQLTGAGIPANNRLFDTLDTTSRQLSVSDNLDVILSDTVGFIAKLPHHLVDAFRATLEELEYADLLLHVIDSSDPNREDHIQVVDKLIAKLAKPGTKVLRCYNKADLVAPEDIPIGEDVVKISAARGEGMEQLLQAIERALGHSRHHVVVTLPYSMGGMVDTLHSGAQVLQVDYTGEGIVVETILDPILYGKLKEYITKEC